MNSLSQSKYGELRSLYQQVYVSTDEITVDDLSEEVVEEIFDELVQEYVSEGYEIEEVLDIVEDAALDFIEAKVTYGHDTEAPAAPEKKSMLKGRIRYARRKAGEAVKRAGEKVQGAKAMAGIAGSIAKDEVRRAGRAGRQAVVGAAQKKKEQVKKGVKGLIGRGLRKAAGAVGKVASKAAGAASRLGEEVIDEASYSAKAARAGKDIGKPGKAFAKIAKEAGKRYGSEESGKKVAGAVLAKLRKEELELDQMIESLIERGYTEQEAYALVAQFTLDESQQARENPEKYEPVRCEKTPMPPRGDKRREDFEKWYAAQRR